MARPFCSSPAVRMPGGSSGHLWPNSAIEDLAHYVFLGVDILLMLCVVTRKTLKYINHRTVLVGRDL